MYNIISKDEFDFWNDKLTLNCFHKLFFPDGMGGVQNSGGNSEGVGGGGVFKWSKNGNSGEKVGLQEIPSMVGVWVFSGTTHCSKKHAFLDEVTVMLNSQG